MAIKGAGAGAGAGAAGARRLPKVTDRGAKRIAEEGHHDDEQLQVHDDELHSSVPCQYNASDPLSCSMA